MIKLENIYKSYEKNTVLNDLNLHIARGECVTVIGQSGCGKTTMLKLINGLLLPDQGTVTVDGQDVASADLISLRRSIGYVIQNRGLFPHMNVIKNITYVPSISGVTDKKKLFGIAERLVDLVGLDRDVLKRYPGELSGGQQQRVGIARALAAEPKILLMDEPFSALDEITRQALQDELKRLQKELGLTIVFITHDIREASKLGDRIAVMEEGRIIQLDTPQNIIKCPKSLFIKNLFLNTVVNF